MNGELRQAEVAGEVEATARQLAHSTRNPVNPPDSYELLVSLGASGGHLAQVSSKAWAVPRNRKSDLPR